MEQIFSSSNQVAGITQYSLAYHRCLFIDMFFQQWDNDKYRNLASMLANNYRQALSIIKDEGAAIKETMEVLGITSANLEKWHREEVVRATLSQLLSAQRRLPESRLVPLVTTGRSSWST